MKKTGLYLLLVIGIVYFPFVSVQAANVCSASIDKNNYCDEEGEYHDPSFETIKNSNCTSYVKTINKYCSTTCREDAKTFFPTDVPFVSVDRYDSIFGGNHFQWEEIKTWINRECKTTINIKDWKKDFEKSLDPVTNGDTGLVHMLRELHQRYTDIKACDFFAWDAATKEGKDKILGKYAGLTQAYYKSLSKGQIAAIRKTLKDEGVTSENCNKCNNYKETKPYATLVDIIPNVKGGCHHIYEDDFDLKSIRSQYNLNAKESTIADRIIIGSSAEMGTEEGAVNCRAYICIGDKDPKTGRYKSYKPDALGFCPNAASIITGSGDARVYNAVVGENLGTTVGLKSEGYATYCIEKKIPYNSEGWDIELPGQSVNGLAATGNNKYQQSFVELQKQIKKMTSYLVSCNTEAKKNNEKTDNTNISVNYLDNPTNHYKKNVQLNKNVETTNSQTNIVKTNGWQNGISWSSCANMTQTEILETFRASISKGEPASVVCKTENTHDYDQYLNDAINYSSQTTYKYTMPENTYRYVLKDTGESVNSPKKNKNDDVDPPANKFTDIIKNSNRYVDVGYPNYPVHYTTETGTYPISLTYSNVGESGKFIKSAVYSCEYKVINRIIPCTGKDCENPNCTGDKCDRNYENKDGINVIYRPISLTNPFPSETGTGRASGENWTATDIAKYITKNREVKENEVYNKRPLYSFTLDATSIRKIKAYNSSKTASGKKRDYSDFELSCNEKYGKRCLSSFLKNVRNYVVSASGTCLGVNQSNFYSCADKPDQDDIKCGLDKDKKLKCVDCKSESNSSFCSN